MDASKTIGSICGVRVSENILQLSTRRTHTKVISQHLLILQWILRTYGNHRAESTHGAKPQGPAVLTTPLHLPLEDVEHGNNIAETAKRDGQYSALIDSIGTDSLLHFDVAKSQ